MTWFEQFCQNLFSATPIDEQQSTKDESPQKPASISTVESPLFPAAIADQPPQPHLTSGYGTFIFSPPKVIITAEAYMRMCLFVQLSDTEVGWLGTVQRLPGNQFLIEEVFLLDQKVTPVETELSAEGCESLVLQFLEDGDQGMQRVNKLHFWGHSHVRMGLGPSGTDDRTMKRFCREGHEFYIRGILNKLGRAAFDIYYCSASVRMLDVEWCVGSADTTLLKHSYGHTAAAPRHLPDELVPSDELRAAVKAEYVRKVRERSWIDSWSQDLKSSDEPEGTSVSLWERIRAAFVSKKTDENTEEGK